MYSVIQIYIRRKINHLFKRGLILAIDKLYSDSKNKDYEFFNYFAVPIFLINS